MSAVEDFSRYVDNQCVCGHARAAHLGGSGWCMTVIPVGPHCVEFFPDNGIVEPDSVVNPSRHQPYDGVYSNPGNRWHVTEGKLQ